MAQKYWREKVVDTEVSQHLRKLKDRKLIEAERQAHTIYYLLNREYKKILNPIFNMLEEVSCKDKSELFT